MGGVREWLKGVKRSDGYDGKGLSCLEGNLQIYNWCYSIPLVRHPPPIEVYQENNRILNQALEKVPIKIAFCTMHMDFLGMNL